MTQLALHLEVSLPKIMEMTKNPNFLLENLQSETSMPVIDAICTSVTNLLKIAESDYIKIKKTQADFEASIEAIQAKVVQL